MSTLSASNWSQPCAITTEILGSAEDFVRIWQPLAALRDSIGMGQDVLTDPLHFLASTDARRRPCAVACWMGEELVGVLFATARFVFGLPTGCAMAGDFIGRGSLLCLPEHQSAVIDSSVSCLMRRAVHSLQLCFTPAESASPNLYGLVVKQFDRRIPGDRMALANTYDGFLSTLGKNTRRNIRYYTRRAAAAGMVFTPEVSAGEYASAVERLSRGTRFAIGAEAFARVERLMELHGGTRFALRDRSGEIVATLCGFSRHGRFHLLTQNNDAGHADLSLSLVLRGLTVEHLIATGHSEMQFMGGSSLCFARFCTELDYRTLFVDRRQSITTPIKLLTSRLVGMLLAWKRPFPGSLAVLSGSYLASTTLVTRTALMPALMLEQECLAREPQAA